jgi:hypothetical protein
MQPRAALTSISTSDPATTLKEAAGGALGVLIIMLSWSAFKQGVEVTRKLITCALVGLTSLNLAKRATGIRKEASSAWTLGTMFNLRTNGDDQC